MSDEKPGIIERYSNAIQSSHLELSPIRRGAADFLLAVGMCRGPDGERETLGSMLMRLMCEFDSAKGEYIMARRNQSNALARAKVNKQPEAAAELVHQAEVDALSAHQHILLKLPSLPHTREAFGRWTTIQASKRKFMDCGDMPIATSAKFKAWRQGMADRQAVIGILAGRVLDVFLEPTCIRCSGRGFNGGYNGMQTICNTRGGCGGSGKRSIDNIGNTREQHEFSYFLYGQAEHLLTNVEIQLAERLRDDAPRVTP
jgi:hypothetical protein